MSEKKTIRFFSVIEYEKEQEYLREQHKKGWKLVKVSGVCCYTFMKCEPEDVVYQLDYNECRQDNKGEYIQMFRDCGWDYICDYVGYSYFRKPVSEMKEEEEIYSDDSSKLDMIDRVFKGRMVPLLVLFFCVICPQLVGNWFQTSTFAKGLFITYLCLFVLYVVIFIRWTWMYCKLRQRTKKR